MVQEVGWDSEKPGYDGLIEVANRLMVRRSNSETKEAAVRILRSLFPPFLLDLYRMLISPIQGGKVAAVMQGQRHYLVNGSWVLVLLTLWTFLMDPHGVVGCKYLEESKCVGICINTCKFPTQTFFKDYMGVPLLMEPNFSDYSCQFRFGVLPPPAEDDSALKEPCLEICPNASRRRELTTSVDVLQCPKA
ncbi:beta-carotene isomerase D27, chloroplastic isoform X3 [Actinidia eriantha]|uniref:beta-carotene isomerase D27, chloroplastic isoform X3 n=1 Tax=Actinidia eriantha TaxID=165200 RepID=UPI00258AC315|nr:beta-carotene isomerase D27, chloroplastic isoform X3 [Actinidia eriantha]